MWGLAGFSRLSPEHHHHEERVDKDNLKFEDYDQNRDGRLDDEQQLLERIDKSKLTGGMNVVERGRSSLIFEHCSNVRSHCH